MRALCSRTTGLDEQWTPRELRHTFVSLLSDNGIAIEEISRLVGHSSSNVTETVYGTCSTVECQAMVAPGVGSRTIGDC
jgi:integrase